MTSLIPSIRKAAPFLLAVPFVIVLGMYAYAGTFMRYSGDDYCYASAYVHNGFLPNVWFSYFQPTPYNGDRYALTLFSNLFDVFGPLANQFLPALGILLWGVGMYVAWREISKLAGLSLKAWHNVLLSAALVFFALYTAPLLGQILYWRSGMLPYMAPLIVNTFLMGWLINRLNRGNSPFLVLLGLFLMAFLAAGFSETAAALQIGIYGWALVLVFFWRRQRKNIQPVAVVLAGSLMGMIGMALSPNTAYRQAALHLPAPPDLTTLVLSSLRFGYDFFHTSLSGLRIPHLLLFAIGFFLASLIQAQERRNGNRLAVFAAQLGLTALIGYSLITILCAPTVYAMGVYPEPRGLFTARWITVLTVTAAGWFCGDFARGWLSKSISNRWIRAAGLAALALIAIYPLRTVPGLVTEARHAARWAQFWDLRDRQILQAREEGNQNPDVVLMDHIIPDVAEIGPNPGFWYNNCAAGYYHVQTITADQPGWDKD